MTYDQFLFAALIAIFAFLIIILAVQPILTIADQPGSVRERRGRILCRIGLHDKCEVGQIRGIRVEKNGVEDIPLGTFSHCHRPGCTWTKTTYTAASRSSLP